MFYGIAYGATADVALQRILDSKRVFGKADVARLKPLDSEALTFVPSSVSTPDVGIRLSESDRKTLILTIPGSSNAETARLNGNLRNDFFPYDIKSATVFLETAGFKLSDGKSGLKTELSDVGSLKISAGESSRPLAIDLQIPPLPSMFAPEVIFGNGYRLTGVLRLRLTDQKLVVSPKFVSSMNELFPKDPLPDLFVPGTSSERSITEQPLVIQVEYPTWPLLVAVLAATLLLGLLSVPLFMMGRVTKYKVSVDGHDRIYALKPFGSVEIRNMQGDRIGVLKRGVGHPNAVKDEKYKAVSVRIQQS
jgi:hypothetical protein